MCCSSPRHHKLLLPCWGVTPHKYGIAQLQEALDLGVLLFTGLAVLTSSASFTLLRCQLLLIIDGGELVSIL